MRMLSHAIQMLAHDQESSIAKNSHPQTKILHESCIVYEHALHDPDFPPLRVLKSGILRHGIVYTSYMLELTG